MAKGIRIRTKKNGEKVYYMFWKRDGKVTEKKINWALGEEPGIVAAETKRHLALTAQAAEQKLNRAHTVDSLSKLYFAQRNPNGGYQSDRSRYKNHLQKLFGKKHPEDIKALDIKRLRSKLEDGDYSPQTIKHCISLLKWIVIYGQRHHSTAGMDCYIKPVKVKNSVTETISKAQMERLKEVLKKDPCIQGCNIIKFILCTGARPKSVYSLRWNDITKDKIIFTDVKSFVKGEFLELPLSDALRDILASQPKLSEYVFSVTPGRRRTRNPKSIKKICDAAGLKGRQLYQFRHHVGTLLANSGLPIQHAAWQLGHKNPETTFRRYVKPSDEALKKNAEILSGMLA